MEKVYKKLKTQVGKEEHEIEFAIVYQSAKYEIHRVKNTDINTGEEVNSWKLTLRNRPDCWMMEERESDYGIVRRWKNYGYYFDFEAMKWIKD